MPSPLTKAEASARLNLSAIRCASHPSTSKAESSSSRCDAFGSAESSWSGIEIRSTCGVPVSATAPALRRPARADVGMVDEHVEGARLDADDVGDRPDRRRRAQHADDLAPPSADRPDSRPPPPPRVDSAFSSTPRPRSAVVVARAQVGGEGLLVRGLGLGGTGERGAAHGDGLAVEHGETVLLFVELRLDLGLEGGELGEKPGHRRLDLGCAGFRRTRPAPGTWFQASASVFRPR